MDEAPMESEFKDCTHKNLRPCRFTAVYSDTKEPLSRKHAKNELPRAHIFIEYLIDRILSRTW